MPPLKHALRRHAVLLTILVLQSSLLGVLVVRTSPTSNEPGHLVAGMAYWRTGHFGLYSVNPPLVRLAAAWPAAIGSQWDSELLGFAGQTRIRDEFELSAEFFRSQRWTAFDYLRMGRMCCLPFALLGTVVCFTWARQRFGMIAGPIAGSLWAFSPLTLSHSALITSDAHGAALGLMACYFFDVWLRLPTWKSTIVGGLVLGIAELSKTTLIVLMPLWPVIWMITRWPQRKTLNRGWFTKEAVMQALRLVVGILVVNTGYLFEGTFTRLGDYQFISELLAGNGVCGNPENRFAGSWIGEIPIPFPYHYVSGMDYQQSDFENMNLRSYLNGEFSDSGWWYYYVYVVLYKTPLGTLGLVLIGLAAFIRTDHRLQKLCGDSVMWLPPMVFFLVVSSKSGFSAHGRYLLPCIPFVFVLLGGLGKLVPKPSQIREFSYRKQRLPEINFLMGVLVTFCFFSTLTASLICFPYSLGFFNSIAGGHVGGPSHLLSSNVDWGQDLLNLIRQKHEIDSHLRKQSVCHVEHVFPAVLLPDDGSYRDWPTPPPSGRHRADANHNDLTRPDPVADWPEGYYAISVGDLFGQSADKAPHPPTSWFHDKVFLQELRRQEPIARAGYSIWIYDRDQVIAASHCRSRN
jgi:hypothetical protein